MNQTIENFYNGLGDEAVADRVKENNTNNKFYWLNNKKGRKVPVNATYAVECLTKGYTHTDGLLYSDDMTPKPEKAKVSEKKQLANAMERIAEKLVPEAKTETVAETKKASTLEKEAFKNLTREQLVTLGLEKGLTEKQIEACETKQAIIDLF